MLANIRAEDFVPLIGSTCHFKRQELGDIQLRILAVRPRPLAQMTDGKARRTPFVVELACEPAPGLTDSLGDLRLPEAPDTPARQLPQVWIGRVIPAGRDPALAYFQLPFN
ncbi:hypothetical protein [Paludibacterium purpuratum]|uniref:Uncharacterized protein n=1 Tax=Paludibacterium purpuratum TaxID=1144873 RepID=A0A4R7B2C8_9NEIS|nr:hypothetical protein [Paludibacterium purpuratum]TDR77889.1 hypothetical protein DFP86_109136 [Paludibacterium purpuratum]